jgi:undecaprenyl-diphosphatase
MSLAERAAALDALITRPLIIPERQRVSLGAALALAHTGDAVVWAGLLALAWALGDPVWKGRALVTAVGLVVVELVVVGVKFIIRRPRPEGGSGMIYRKVDPYSFPSGHAARAAMLVVFSAALYPSGFTAAVAVWGPVMGISRVAIGIHYVLDIIAGALFGAGLAWALLALVPVLLSLL